MPEKNNLWLSEVSKKNGWRVVKQNKIIVGEVPQDGRRGAGRDNCGEVTQDGWWMPEEKK